MRRRIGIAGMTGLGNPAPNILENEGELTPAIKEMLDEAIKTFPLMRKYEGCDFSIQENRIRFGIEPSYMYEHLEMVSIERTKENSYREQGHAWGGWGSGIAKTRKYYSEYKRRSVFIRFIDKWHPRIFPL